MTRFLVVSHGPDTESYDARFYSNTLVGSILYCEGLRLSVSRALRC